MLGPLFISCHRRCSVKKLFFNISQYSQENSCVGVYFSGLKVFSCEYCNFFKNTYSENHLLKAALRSLRSFTRVSWAYLPSTDISCSAQFRRFLSFLCCYLFSKWNIYFFILIFSDPIIFSLSFPVFYFPLLICLSLHIPQARN